ncbi:hypothetical protein [Thioalkalivibrio sp.]|uniref:hypothetical protein n=1 Tax=Thioalkalivibrio sp. TaxID=2093813 RepID=UPI003568D659
MGKSKPKPATSQLDPDFKDAWLEQYSNAQNIAGDLQARRFAGFTPDWQAGAGMARTAAGTGQGAVNMGLGAAGQAAGYDPMMIGAQGISNYMNPYMDQVADRTLQDMERQRQLQMQGIGDQAIQAGAFGGSRHGVTEAETNRGFGDLFGNQMAQMRHQGFGTAAELNMQEQMQNQQAGVEGQQLNLAGAGMLGNLGQMQQNMGLTGANALQNLGSQQQQLSQQQMDAIRNLPLEQQQLINANLGLAPGGGAGMINQGATSGSSGLLGAVAPIAGAVLGGPIGAGMAGSMFGAPQPEQWIGQHGGTWTSGGGYIP